MEHTSNAKILIADENAAQRTQLRESLRGQDTGMWRRQ